MTPEEELIYMKRRREDSLKALIMVELDNYSPDERPAVAARVFGQILEKLARRDTQRTRVPIPREDP